jgi:hypothetical protein
MMMSKKWMLLVALAATGIAPVPSSAAGLTVLRPEPGLKCMLLDDQALQATVQTQLPPLRSAPSASAAIVGYPAEIVFVRWPLQQQAGYVVAVKFNSQPGWIEADKLQPWHAMNGRPGKCIPSLMSNGLLGTHIEQ